MPIIVKGINITKNITEAQAFSALETWDVLISELTNGNMVFFLITFLSILKFLIIQTGFLKIQFKILYKEMDKK